MRWRRIHRRCLLVVFVVFLSPTERVRVNAKKHVKVVTVRLSERWSGCRRNPTLNRKLKR